MERVEPNPGRRAFIDRSVAKSLLFFSLPILITSILQSASGTINTIWVGRLLGASALAATTNANQLIMLAYSMMFGLGIALTIGVGQKIGSGQINEARRLVGSGAAIFVLMAVVMIIIGRLWGDELLSGMGTPRESLGMAILYFQITLLSLPSNFLSMLIASALRGCGDAVSVVPFIVLSLIIDVALNPLFIEGAGAIPAMGVSGSAYATLVGSIASVISLVMYVYFKDLPIRLKRSEFRYLAPDGPTAALIIGKGGIVSLQMVIAALASLAVVGLVNEQGVNVVAAYGAICQVWAWFQLPAVAIGAAVSAMAAQYIGAGHWGRISQLTRCGILVSILVSVPLVGGAILFGERLMSVFLGDNELAIDQAQRINLIVSWSFILFAITQVLSAVVRASGFFFPALLILFICLFPVRFTAIYFLTSPLGADALWWSFSIGGIVGAVLSVSYYRNGSWRPHRPVDLGLGKIGSVVDEVAVAPSVSQN